MKKRTWQAYAILYKTDLKDIQRKISEALSDPNWSDLELWTEDGYDGDVDIVIYGNRLETDEEYAARLAQETQYKADEEAILRRTYEELKKKFEGDGK